MTIFTKGHKTRLQTVKIKSTHATSLKQRKVSCKAWDKMGKYLVEVLKGVLKETEGTIGILGDLIFPPELEDSPP